MPNWNQLSQDVLSLFLNPNCPLCGRSTQTVLCQSCHHRLDACQLSHPKSLGKGKIPLIAWGKYDGFLKHAIASLKYHQQPHIARPLGERLGKTWLTHFPISPTLKPVVVPIPLHPHKEKQRGYNQATLLARAFCSITRLKMQPHGLKRIKNTAALYDLNPDQRQAQVKEAFIFGKGLKPQQNVIILDDIYTTGSTVQAAKMTLQQANIKVIGVCAIAKP